MQNVFLKLGINRRKSVLSITDDNINTKVDEKLPEEKSCSSPNPVGESSDGQKDGKTVGVDEGNLCDMVEQNSPIGRRSLMQITGEFPRLHCKIYSEEPEIRTAWFKKDLTNTRTIQQIYLGQSRSSPQKR